MKNILIPTDFSDNSWNATEYALNFFKNTPCNFYLLHVTLTTTYIGEESQLFTTTEMLQNTILKQAQEGLDNLLNKINKLYANPKHHFFTISNYNFFVDAVKTQIEEKKIDLIVMGTKGASGISEVVIGTNTGDVITKVKCPVLTIPENATFKAPEKIAFPTDYNLHYQPSVLNEISEFVEQYHSTLKILHISKEAVVLSASQKENKHYLQNFFNEEKHSTHKIINKKIEEGIQSFTESRNIDMIIMVAKNLTLFQQIFFKPTVEEISYHTEVPFLVLHE